MISCESMCSLPNKTSGEKKTSTFNRTVDRQSNVLGQQGVESICIKGRPRFVLAAFNPIPIAQFISARSERP